MFTLAFSQINQLECIVQLIAKQRPSAIKLVYCYSFHHIDSMNKLFLSEGWFPVI